MSESNESRELWNPAVALRRMGADTDLLCCMIDCFVEDSQLLLQELKERIEAGDVPEASRMAHSLKGLSSNFDADAATEAGAIMEAACVAMTLDEASALLPQLTKQIDQLSRALTHWKNAQSQAAD